MGSKAPTTTSTNTVPPQVLAQYQKVLDRANPVADTPYQPYGGQLTAPLNDLQNQAYWGLGITQHISEPYAQQGLGQATSGFNTTSGALPYYQQGAAGVAGAQPYYKAASDYANASTGPLNLSQYLNPYTQNVVDTTMANAQRNNAIARQGVVGNAISSGAWGGDRAGVAQAELARNQAMTDNATIAGLENANYSQALTAAQADQARKAQAASLMGGLGNSQIQAGLGYGQLASGVGTLGGTMTGQGVATAGLGTAAQNNAINAYNAQMAGGTQAQQTAQNDLNAQYQQWANAIAFPYQQLGWLSNISTGIGSGSGSTTTTTGSAPSAASQILGGATALAGLFKLRRGGVVPGYAGGGVASGFSFPRAGMYGTDMVSTPGSTGLVPAIRINAARLSAPAAIDPNKGQADPVKMGQQAAGAISGLSGLFNGPSYGGASSAMGDPTGLGGLYRKGGVVRGFAGGGALDFDDRFAPTLDAEASGLFQPYSVDSNSPIVPDPGLQQVSPEAVQAWRNEADTPNPAVAADQGLAQSQPAPLPPQITGDPQPLPDNALAFDGAGLAPRSVPTQILPPVAQQSQGLSQSVDAGSRPAGGLLGKMGMTEDQRMAMLQLGLGLLASRSPNFGTALGEAGLGAAAAMNQTQQTRAAQAIKDREYGLDVQRLQQQADQARQRLALDQRRLALESDPAAIRQLRALGIDPKSEEARRLLFPKSEDEFTIQKVEQPDGSHILVRVPKRGPEGVIDTTGGKTANNPLLTGEDYLKTLPPDTAATVKKLASYDISPRDLSIKGGHRERLLAATSRYDPNFSSSDYNTRFATRKDFTSGKSAQNLTAFNTAIGHLDSLDKSIDALGNRTSPMWNSITGSVSQQYDKTYQTALKAFRTSKTAVIDELTRAFRGSGGNVHDLIEWGKAINEADSPEALHAAVKQAVELLRSRIESVGDAYNRGMGTTREGITLLSPKARETLRRLEGEKPSMEQAAMTATGPNGQKLTLRNGKWETAQ